MHTPRWLPFGMLLVVISLGACRPRGPLRPLAHRYGARPPHGAGQEVPSDDAAASWAQRDDPFVLASLIDHLETAFADNQADHALLTQLSRAYFLQARLSRQQNDREKMKESLSRGVLVGESALLALYPAMRDAGPESDAVMSHLNLIDPNGMNALTWYVSNLGAYAASRGMTSLIFYRDRVTAILERMLTLDPNFMYGTPHRYWAIYLARAPAFAGGDLEQARVHFDKALGAYPNYFANACDYAQFYAVPKGDRALFERLLTGVVDGDSNALPDMAPEMRLEQARARALLAQTEKLF